MSSILSSFAGNSPDSTNVVGYPEQNGQANFGQNQQLGQVQSPGSGFLGGLYGNQQANSGAGNAAGGLLGAYLNNRLGQSPLGALLGIQGQGGGQGGQMPLGLEGVLGNGQYPHLEAIVKLLGGGGAPRAQAGGISSFVGGYTGGIVGGHGGAGTG